MWLDHCYSMNEKQNFAFMAHVMNVKQYSASIKTPGELCVAVRIIIFDIKLTKSCDNLKFFSRHQSWASHTCCRNC